MKLSLPRNVVFLAIPFLTLIALRSAPAAELITATELSSIIGSADCETAYVSALDDCQTCDVNPKGGWMTCDTQSDTTDCETFVNPNKCIACTTIQTPCPGSIITWTDNMCTMGMKKTGNACTHMQDFSSTQNCKVMVNCP